MKASLQLVSRIKIEPHVQKVLSTLWHEVCLYEGESGRGGQLDIYVVGEGKIKEVNQQYRKMNKVTDVVSLDFGVDQLGQKVGVIYIAAAVLRRMAARMKHSFEQELVFIALHGMLHVWGHDHEHLEEEKNMLKAKEILLQNFPRYSPLLSTYGSRSSFDS